MRIGIDARMYGAESTTGIGVYIKNLTDELFKIDQTNEYFIFMLDPAYSNFLPPNIRVKKIKIDCPWYSWSEQLKLPKILLKYKLDLVHFPHFNVPIFYPGKFISTIHDITPYFFPGPKAKKSIVRQLGYQVVFKFGIKKAKKIITVSNHTKENLSKYFKIPKVKIEVTHLGIDSNFKEIDDKTVLSGLKNKYKIDKQFIFYVGVWRDHKNLVNLIKAFNVLKSDYQLDYQLVLGGKPDERYPEILKAINTSPYKTDIIMTGFIPQTELSIFYNAADLFVLPSFCEGFGLVALEALACGTPVAGSNSTSLPEVLEDAAVYFDPKDSLDIAKSINLVLRNPDLYQDLKKRGLNQIKKYTWAACAQKTLAIYQTN